VRGEKTWPNAALKSSLDDSSQTRRFVLRIVLTPLGQFGNSLIADNELTAIEIAALASTHFDCWFRAAAQLDPRLQKADLSSQER
jgi:hypothetical protein